MPDDVSPAVGAEPRGVEVVGVQVDELSFFALAFAIQLRQRAIVQPDVGFECLAAARGFTQQLAVQVVVVDGDLRFFARQFLARAQPLGVVVVDGYEAVCYKTRLAQLYLDGQDWIRNNIPLSFIVCIRRD